MASVINLATPISSERRRGFQPPWYTVYVYECERGHRVTVRAGAFRGATPVPSMGGIYCSQCEREETNE